MGSPLTQILGRSSLACHGRNATNRQESRNLRCPDAVGRNGARAVEFYKAAFGAQVLFRHDDPKAGVVARLSLGEMRLLADGRAFQFQPRDFWAVELQE